MSDDLRTGPGPAAGMETPSGIPGPAAGVQTPPGIPGPAAAARRQPYGSGKRAFYGILWAGWTVVLAIAGFAALFGGQILGGLAALALAALAGRYDFRIWTWRARRLLFFIIW